MNRTSAGLLCLVFFFFVSAAAAPPGVDDAWWKRIKAEIEPECDQQLSIAFREDGVLVRPGSGGPASWEFGMSLDRHGSKAVASTESYEKTPGGFTQRLTISAPPGRHHSGARLDLKLTGTLRPRIAAGGEAVDFFDGGNVSVLRLGALRATDATGAKVSARFEGIPGGVRVAIDDGTAAYPLSVDSLVTSASWTGSGDQNGDEYGYSVATAGDVNGDGFSDVIVGAPLHDAGGIGSADRGRAYLYLGSAAGVASAPSWTITGDSDGSRLGWSVSTAGDVNGDGYSDVIVSAYLQDLAYVYLGSANGLASTPSWSVFGDQLGAWFGYSVSAAGDVNGDGYSDVIVGAPQDDAGGASGAHRGRAFVYLGGPGGLATTPSWTGSGDENGAWFGVSVATAGDVNGDGYSDVIVGAYLHDAGGGSNANRGRAYVYLGGPGGLAASPTWTGSGDENGAFFGECVATAGDVNGDGYADILVGAPEHDAGGGAGANRGRAYLYLGSASGPAGTAAWTDSGSENGAGLGFSLATAGDVNGDGYADVFVGAYDHDAGAGSGANRGQAYLFLGSGSGLAANPIWTGSGDENGAFFGRSVATAGDVNGDGYSDVIVGADGHDAGAGAGANRGRAYVYLGSGGGPATSPASTYAGDTDGAQLGYSVAGAGDVNGDGYSDVIVGANARNAGAGAAYLYLGSASGLPALPTSTVSGDESQAMLGSSVATAGDVNGDGYADVIVGAPLHDAGGGLNADRGRAYLYLGSAGGLAASPAWIGSGDEDGGRYGTSVATAGDVNGDGYADVIVGAEDHTAGGGPNRGRAYLYLGSAAGLSPTPVWTVSGDQDDAHFGYSVATAGDVNGDGYSDVVVGAYRHGAGGIERGRAYVYLGSAGGLATSPVATLSGDADNARFGNSVASAGDINGDGYSDIVIGAYRHDAGGGPTAQRGQAYLYLGGSGGVAASPAWTGSGDENGAAFGWSLGTAGDVNGDGYSDVIVGADLHDAGAGSGANRGRVYLFLGSAAGLATTAAWTVSGDENGGMLGASVAMAGDVGGDGASDVLAGAPSHSAGPGAYRGMAYLYHGNAEGQVAGGLDRAPSQLRTDAATPIALLGKSDSETEFRVRARGRTAAGRGKVILQSQAKPLGTPFDAAGIDASAPQDTGAPGIGGSAASFNVSVAGLVEGTFYRWRTRTVSRDPYFPGSPWMTLAGGSATETKLRTPGCIDRDGDGYGDAGDPSCLSLVSDCNDHDATVWNTPGETRNLRFTSHTALTWDPPLDPGALVSALVYDTIRSGVASDFQGAATCVETGDGPNTTATDPLAPSAGQVFFYLSRAKDTCAQGSGALGTNSQGVPRAGRSCP